MMKNYSFILVSAILTLPVIASCTPEQLNSAIEACKGDPECYQIVDDAIESELESRGITGGLMTNIELENLFIMLEKYKDDVVDEQIFEVIEISISSSMEGGNETQEKSELLDEISELRSNSQIIKQHQEHFNFREINQEEKQLVIKNNIKYVVYKTSASTFTYEVFADQKITFNLDTDLDALYLNGFRLKPSATMRIETIYNTFKSEVVQNDNHLTFASNNYSNGNYRAFNLRVENGLEYFTFFVIDSTHSINYYFSFSNKESLFSNVQFSVANRMSGDVWGYSFEFGTLLNLFNVFSRLLSVELINKIIGGTGQNYDPNHDFSEDNDYQELMNFYSRELEELIAEDELIEDISSEIIFNSMGGSILEPIRGTIGTLITAPEEPVKEDFVFGGWFIDETFTEPMIFPYKFENNDLTLYAKWDLPFIDSGVWYLVGTFSPIEWDYSNPDYLFNPVDIEKQIYEKEIFLPVGTEFKIVHGDSSNPLELGYHNSLEIPDDAIENHEGNFKVLRANSFYIQFKIIKTIGEVIITSNSNWVGFGMNITNSYDGTMISYENIPMSWWEHRSELYVSALVEGKKLRVTFIGVAGHEYMFSLQGQSVAIEQFIDANIIVMTNEANIIEIDYSILSESDLKKYNRLVFFVKSPDVIGEISIREIKLAI